MLVFVRTNHYPQLFTTLSQVQDSSEDSSKTSYTVGFFVVKSSHQFLGVVSQTADHIGCVDKMSALDKLMWHEKEIIL